MSVVIKIENVSKQYRLGSIGTNTLKGDLQRWWHNLCGLPDPTLMIGQENNLSASRLTPHTLSPSEFIWALKEINFEVQQGEVLGIIGKNGAGKSTLLKLLSRVTAPTTGSIKVKGRIASLLEVGTGFHPELTGRENIFLNGAILGMTKSEISNKFDEIVDFAGISQYIDTPVKRYSSGMYVRLAFAVAAHLEPEILIVDEVLAVGDAEFQKKAIGKMKDVSKNDGRTVLFVSHNMAAIQKLCETGILLKNGQVFLLGKVDHIINKYLASGDASHAVYEILIPADSTNLIGFAYLLKVEDSNGDLVNEIPVGKPWQIRVIFRLNKKVNHFIIALGITNSLDVNVRTTWSKEMDLNEGDYEAIFKEEHLLFATGIYHLALGLSSFERTFQYIENVATITISDIIDLALDKTIIRTSGTGLFLNPMDIDISIIK
jgi:ABC-type polysaccharide/polyol phosphate transport system ATPase subunit